MHFLVNKTELMVRLDNGGNEGTVFFIGLIYFVMLLFCLYICLLINLPISVLYNSLTTATIISRVKDKTDK